jgi:hypothetical protein
MKHLFCTLKFTCKFHVLVIALIFPVWVFAWDFDTPVSIYVNNASISEVFTQLSVKFKIPVTYNQNSSALKKEVTISATNMPLGKVLDTYLVPLGIRYKKIADQLVISVTATGGFAYTVSGFVEDSIGGEKLVGATVIIQETGVVTTTNNFGFFSIACNNNEATLIVSHAGYSLHQRRYQLSEDRSLNVKMNNNTSLTEVIVVGNKTTPLQDQTQMSKVSLPVTQVKSVPRFLGETDLVKALQMMPGIQQGSEVTGGMLVRGGSPDQSLILLDGSAVYNMSHVFGVFSIFNADAIKNIEVYKGAFPARFGGRLSAVADIVLKDGSMEAVHGDGSIGVLTSKLTLEGPLKKNKSSFIVSARRTFPDLLLIPFIQNQDDVTENLRVNFYDISAKLRFELSAKNRLLFSYYTSRDFLRIKYVNNNSQRESFDDSRFGWSNHIAAINWNHVFNKRLFANTTLNFTRYRFKVSGESYYKSNTSADNYRINARYQSGIYDISARLNFDYRPAPNHAVKTGFYAMSHVFTPGASVIKSNSQTQGGDIDTSFNTINQSSPEMGLYAEDEWNINNKVSLNAGFHFNLFKAPAKWYASIQPRLTFRYLLPGAIALKLSYAHMNQYIHFLSYNGLGIPADLWVPSTNKVKPMLSSQLAIGLAKSIYKNIIDITIEGFYKKMNGIIEYKDGETYLNSETVWDEKVEQGKGKAYGIELMIHKKKGKLNGWVGYTLSRSERQFKEINKGKSFPFKYDRLHDLEIMIIQQLSKRWEISLSWQFQTSTPYTISVGRYESLVNGSPFDPDNLLGGTGNPAGPVNPYQSVNLFEGRNAVRLLNYHRLDIGFTYRRKKKRYEKYWNFGLYNAYNRNNPYLYQLVRIDNAQKLKLKGVGVLPVLPSIAYGFKF